MQRSLKSGLTYVLTMIIVGASVYGLFSLLLLGVPSSLLAQKGVLGLAVTLGMLTGPIFWNLTYPVIPATSDIMVPKNNFDLIRPILAFHVAGLLIFTLTGGKHMLMSIVIAIACMVSGEMVFHSRRVLAMYMREVDFRRELAGQMVKAMGGIKSNDVEFALLDPLRTLFAYIEQRGGFSQIQMAQARERIAMVRTLCNLTNEKGESAGSNRLRVACDAFDMVMSAKLASREMAGIMMESYVARIQSAK